MDTDIAIIGSGFSGLGMAIRLKQAGMNDFVVLERAGEVGGTWQANTYPGCACDVPSHLYSFSFAPNPDWTQTYSTQPEIWAYLRRVADDFGVRSHVRLNTAVESAAWAGDHWELETSRGTLRARVLIAGMGPLTEPKIPEIPGLEDFDGPVFHSARWDHDADLKGKRVASIGTGASAIQYVPAIQPEVGQLHVFQRTAPWVLPHSNRPIRDWEKRLFRARARPPAAGARRRLRRPRGPGARLRQEPQAHEGRRAAGPQAHAAPDRRPGAAGEGHARLHDRLQAHPALQPLVPGARQAQRRARHRRHQRGARQRRGDRRRARA